MRERESPPEWDRTAEGTLQKRYMALEEGEGVEVTPRVTSASFPLFSSSAFLMIRMQGDLKPKWRTEGIFGIIA